MRLAVLTSGGKDSLFSAYLMQKEGHEISHFLTVVPETSESYMFHHPNVELTRLQAKAARVKLQTATTKGEKEKELADLKHLILGVRGEVDGIIAGAVASLYQKRRVEAICSEVGIRVFTPLWQKNPTELLREMLRENFEIIITSVAARGLDAQWLGRRIDEKCVQDLLVLAEKYKVHVSGEGGEYETLVVDMPMFEKKLEILDATKKWEGSSGVYIVKEATLVDKS
jgi:ABC transporter with metal-binding/Fe-S-binding domain ATP-binding protein